MAKRLVEMALNYSGMNPEIERRNLSGISSLNEEKYDAYMQAGFDVLKEIEDIAYRRYSSDDDGTSRNRDLIKCIRELKGE